MPIKTGASLKDPVAAIARGIERVDDLGHADTRDFVLEAVRLLALDRDVVGDDKIEQIATDLFEDCGERYATAPQMAAFIYARLTVTS